MGAMLSDAVSNVAVDAATAMGNSPKAVSLSSAAVIAGGSVSIVAGSPSFEVAIGSTVDRCAGSGCAPVCAEALTLDCDGTADSVTSHTTPDSGLADGSAELIAASLLGAGSFAATAAASVVPTTAEESVWRLCSRVVEGGAGIGSFAGGCCTASALIDCHWRLRARLAHSVSVFGGAGGNILTTRRVCRRLAPT